MVEKIIVSPEQVRGGGNIISPAKELSDYTGYLSDLTESNTTVNGLPVKVFDLSLNNSIVGAFNIDDNGHLIFTLEGNTNIQFYINAGHLMCSGTNEQKYHINNAGHCMYGE